jgi:hypothetical protein
MFVVPLPWDKTILPTLIRQTGSVSQFNGFKTENIFLDLGVVVSEGRLVHIDFGFILETSPGGNLRFESAQFKLSHEMTQLLDPSGTMKSETWYRFVRSDLSALCRCVCMYIHVWSFIGHNFCQLYMGCGWAVDADYV